MKMQNIIKQSYIAELIGTFSLTLLVSLTLTSRVPEAAVFAAALTVTIFVYTIGAISGCHINPAVTVGLWSVGKINKIDVSGYLVAQFLGALLAMQAAIFMTGSVPDVSGSELPAIGLAEAAGAAFLVFGVCAVVFKKAPEGSSGLTIGGSLLIGVLVASTIGNGVINPAVAVGIGSLSFTYLLAPLIGGILSAQLYRWLVV